MKHPTFLVYLLAALLISSLYKAQCPASWNASNFSFSPAKSTYCPQDDLTVTFTFPANLTLNSATWGFSGSAVSKTQGPANTYNIVKILSGGLLTLNANVKVTVSGTPCSPQPNISTPILFDAISINAGQDMIIGSTTSQANIGGTAAAVITGGSSPFTYAWTPTTGLSSSSISNPVASPSSNTNYLLTVTDSHACTATDNVMVYNVGSITNNKHYAVLQKKLDAGYYNSITVGGVKYFYFKFDEEYYVPATTNLTYKIYNDIGTLVSTTPALVETIGDNRFALNVNTLTANNYYKIYVYNQKNEVWEGRLKIN